MRARFRRFENERRAPRHGLLCLLLALLVAAISPTVWAAGDDGDDDEDVSDQILLALVPGATIEPVLERYALTPIEHAQELGIWRVRVSPGVDADTLAETMEEDPDLLWAEEHRTSETPEGTQRSIPDLGMVLSATDFLDQPAFHTIHAATAHSLFDGQGVVIAVLDSGVALDHPIIAGVVQHPGSNFLGTGLTAEPRPDGIDNDLDGLIDEGLHHGTFVAGLVGLTAPGASILPIRVLSDEGTGTALALARGIRRAVVAGAAVINVSVGMALESEVVSEAIEDAIDAGVVVVAASGNDGLQQVGFPARIADVIAVGAVDAGLAWAPYTNTGDEIALSAPGEQLISTWGDTGLAGWSGTSFATPLVSGAVALLLDKYPRLAPQDVRSLLLSTSQPGVGSALVVDLEALTRVLLSRRDTLRFEDLTAGTTLRFSPVALAASYDVVRGDLAALRSNDPQSPVVGLASVVCLVEDLPTGDGPLRVTAIETPLPGEGWFYLFRDDAEDGGYGEGTGGRMRVAGAGDCVGR